MKSQINFRASKLTRYQIDELLRHTWMSQTELMSTAIDRMAREEIKMDKLHIDEAGLYATDARGVTMKVAEQFEPDQETRYRISYHNGLMPAHSIEFVDTIEDAHAKMSEFELDPTKWMEPDEQ